jgi:hypothetical protein
MSSRRPPKKPQRVGSLSSLGDVLPGLYRDLDMDKKVNEFALLGLWPSLVQTFLGVSGAAQTRAFRLRKQGYQTVLMVKVSNAALASELSFQLMHLKEALNGYTPQTGLTVDRIQLMVGSL